MPYKDPRKYRVYQKHYKRQQRAQRRADQPQSQPHLPEANRVAEGLEALRDTLGSLRETVPRHGTMECRALHLVGDALEQVVALVEELEDRIEALEVAGPRTRLKGTKLWQGR